MICISSVINKSKINLLTYKEKISNAVPKSRSIEPAKYETELTEIREVFDVRRIIIRDDETTYNHLTRKLQGIFKL